ncbi:MAG: hypothetical protein HSCHL_1314 [Hydrogenibacillus schlegelii]|uniref:Inner membrane protein YgaP-like transmembrane domain-containing protein n=3 Tax=Bacillales Family X. Incertae Sedis TaxID=539003 RepID=A0A2T5G5U0_HYDSH|nr:MAG: hypothetical protein HSCHL_1314 [Hydrogenibacillus schlegelii]
MKAPKELKNFWEGGETMKANMGPVDRVIRVIIGIVLLFLVFVGPKTPWGWIGLVPLLTGLIGFCPLYAIFGISTRKSS